MYSKEEVKIIKKYYPVLGSKVLSFLKGMETPSTRVWTVDTLDHAVRNLGVKFGLFEEGEEGFLI